jgi:hypothetical protein
MPRGSKILHVAIKAGIPALYAEVDITQPICIRQIYMFSTGIGLPNVAMEYIGTLIDGPYTWHIYDGGEDL